MPETVSVQELSNRYDTWRASLDSIEFTRFNAFDVVGSGPDSLLDVAGGWLVDEVPDELENTNIASECFYPATAIASDYSPELSSYREQFLGSRLRTYYRGYVCPPSSSTLFRAVHAEDAAWVTRLQCAFLPVAAIAHEGERYVFATWHPTSRGTSHTYSVHQDEPLEWWPFRSIAAYLALQLTEFDQIEGSASDKVKEAVGAQMKLPRDEFPPHLDPEKLEPRTRWIVDLFLNMVFDDDLEHLPTMETWEQEKELTAAWPHLQAYWFLHHLLFNNKAEAAWVRERMDHEHPAVAELEQIALAYDESKVPNFFPQSRISGLRRTVAQRGIAAMGPEAMAEIQAELNEAAKHAEVMETFLTRMASSDDDGVQHLLGTLRMLESAAGDLAGFEGELAKVMYEDQPEIAATYTTRHYCGETSIFLEVFDDLCQLVTPEWEPYFEAAYTRAASVSEEHEDGSPGALVGWGVALGSFGALWEKVDTLPWNAGRRRYAELSLVANHFFEEEQAREFLVSEAGDFVDEFGAWEHGTMSYALFALLKHGAPEGAELLQSAFETGGFSGANWQCSLALVDVCARAKQSELAPAMKAAVDQGLGRHDDSDRARVLRAYAACAGDEAKDVLRQMQQDIDDVRKECEEAAIVSALLDLEPQDDALRARAIELLQTLLDGDGSMELGAAYSLLRSAHDNDVPGFAMLARRAGESDSKYFKDHMKAWLKENAATFV